MEKRNEQAKLYTTLWQQANALYEAWAKRQGISYCELLAVLSLADSGGRCTQAEICRQWLLSKQTVNTVLKSFIQREWVMLVPSETDKRTKIISLTGKGEYSIHTIAAQLREQEMLVLDRMGPERTTNLLETTALYNQLFEETAL